MFFSLYTFTGDRDELMRGYDALVADVQDDLLWHVVVTTEDGIAMVDACPDRETFEHFTAHELPAMLAASGLPTPAITPLGEGVRTVAKPTVTA